MIFSSLPQEIIKQIITQNLYSWNQSLPFQKWQDKTSPFRLLNFTFRRRAKHQRHSNALLSREDLKFTTVLL